MTSPISIRRVVRRTLAIYVGQARVLLALVAVVIVIVAVLGGLARSVPVLGIIVSIASIVVLALFTGAVVMLAANTWEDRPAMTVRELVSSVRPMLGELVVVAFVALIAISLFYFVASLLFVVVAINAVLGGTHVVGLAVIVLLEAVLLLAPGTYLLTGWSVALPVVVLERPGGLRALKRSRRLVRGNRLRVLALTVLFWLLAGIGFVLLEFATRSAAGQSPVLAAQLLVTILLAPIPLIGATALYFELRQTAAGDSPRTCASPHSLSLPTPGTTAVDPGLMNP
jgi:hypothetical protein